LLASIRREAQQLKLQRVERNAATESDVTRVYASLKSGDVVPLASHRKDMAQKGVLFSYGPYYSSPGRDVAGYVDRILKGAKPMDLPVQQASSLELVINLKTAKALGLTIPLSLLARADQVIE
jgi:putative ABC transport system substrate-binding protein